MENYIDFKNFPGRDIKIMFREKQKEYIILIQSEKIAKLILNEYHKPLLTTNYHYRVNKEYYSLYECAQKKQAIIKEELDNVIVSIPYASILRRIEENFELDETTDKEIYQEIMSETKRMFNDKELTYENGYLYITYNNEKKLVDDDLLKSINANGKVYKKK